MAENQQSAELSSPKKSQLLMPSGSSSSELSSSGPSDLRPSPLGRISPSSLSSLTVPVRLDVLYFLLNSAARAAQNTLAPTPTHGGSVSCYGPVAPQAVSCCCNCHPPLHQAPGPTPCTHQPSTHHDRRGPASDGLHGRLSPGIVDQQSSKYSIVQRRDGKTWSGSTVQPDSSRGWKNSQSPQAWKENQRGPTGRYGREDNWREKQVDFRKPWGDQRRSIAESTPWNSGRRKPEELPSFGAHSVNNKNRGGRCQPSGDAPEAKRCSSHLWIGLQKTTGTPEADNFSSKIPAAEPTKTALQDNAEDWETEYNHEGQQGTSPPKSVSADQAVGATGEELPKPHLDWSKNAEFIHYLKSRYADVPQKSSSESSTDLVIDSEASRPEEEEEEEKATAKSN